ncbi:MAG: sensor histidine kinase [Spirochaetales bacterium]
MRSSLLSRIMLVAIPVMIINAAILVVVLQGRTRAQFIVYLSTQEQLERYRPRDQVLIEFYADRIAGVMPVATEASVRDLVDRLAQTLAHDVVVARNDDLYVPSISLRGAGADYRVRSDGRLRARTEEEDGSLTSVEINPLITRTVTPFLPGSTGEDVIRIYMLPDLESPVGAQEERFMSSTARTIVLSVGIGAAILILLLGLVVAESLQPVRLLTAASNAAVDGAIPEPVKESGAREVRELARAFNEVGQRLRTTEQARKRMMGDVSHELRGPIGNLQAQIEAMQDGLLEADQRNLASLHEDVMLLSRLIDDLHEVALADARALSLSFEDTSISELVETSANAYRVAFAEKGVSLATRLELETTVHVDRQRMQQAIGNILSNALRYTGSGGNVTITTKWVTATGSTVRCASHASIELSDTGVGVSERELESIFERFYRTDESRARSSGGSGLGLAVAKGIVISHGGTIRATRRQPQGLCVIIDLPTTGA